VLGALAGGGVLEFEAGDGADDVPLPSEPPQALSRKAIPSACSQRTVTGILLKCVMRKIVSTQRSDNHCLRPTTSPCRDMWSAVSTRLVRQADARAGPSAIVTLAAAAAAAAAEAKPPPADPSKPVESPTETRNRTRTQKSGGQ